MKQKLLYIIMFIATLAWSSGVWGADEGTKYNTITEELTVTMTGTALQSLISNNGYTNNHVTFTMPNVNSYDSSHEFIYLGEANKSGTTWNISMTAQSNYTLVSVQSIKVKAVSYQTSGLYTSYMQLPNVNKQSVGTNSINPQNDASNYKELSSSNVSSTIGIYCTTDSRTGRINHKYYINYIQITYKVSHREYLFNFSASATSVSSAGGIATGIVSNSQIQAAVGVTSASTTATFSATANSGYEFAGWGTSSSATTYESTKNPYTPTISNSTAGSTANKTLYAIFKPVFNFTVTANKINGSYGTVTATVTPKILGNPSDTQKSTEATFTATPNTNCTFEGWYEDAEHTKPASADDSYKNKTFTPSVTNTTIGSTKNLKLYAWFKSNQTLTWTNPSIVNIVNGETTIGAAAATASSGLDVTYSSSNGDVASVNPTTGDVTGVSAAPLNPVTITARQAGNDEFNVVEATRQFTVINKYQATFTPSGFTGTNPTIYVDATPTITLADIDTDFTYTSSDETVVSVVKDGDVLKLTARKVGTADVTLTQPNNTTHSAVSTTYHFTVEKVPNTLAVSLSTLVAQVDGTINVNFPDRNNEGAAIVGTITEQSLSSSVNQTINNETPVITYADGVITACNAGTAKITFTQAETDKYTGYTSATYSITVSKYTNTIIVTLNGEQRNTINIARSTQEAISQVTLGYTSSSESNGAFHVTRTLGSDDIASLSGNTITAGTTTDGINTWTISQDETYKFDPASTTVRVKVNSIAETESYLHTSYTDGSNYSWFTGGGDDYEVTVNYTPLLIRFKSWCDWGGIINESVTVTWKDANGKTINSRKTTISNSVQTIEVLLPENARQFSFSATGSLSQYISDVYVVRKTYVNASSNKTDFGTVYTDETLPTATITVDWGSSNGGDIEAVVENNNPHFTISPSTITGTANSNGTRNLIVTYTPNPNQLGEETANITIGDLFYSQHITLTAIAAKHENTLAVIGAQDLKVDDVVDVYSSKNSSAELSYSFSRNGVATYNPATNKLTAIGAGTTTLTLTQLENDSHYGTTKTVEINVSKYDQAISWDNELTSDDRTLDVGDVLSTNTATASSGLTLTYSSNNADALEVNATTGELIAKAGGSNIAITATQAGNYKYNEASITRYFTVIQKEYAVVTTTLSESVTNIFPIGNPDITIRCNATLTANALSITGDAGVVTSTFASNTFTLTAVNEGTVTVALTRAEDEGYYAVSKTYTIQVIKPVLVLNPSEAPVINYQDYSSVTYSGTLKSGYSTIALPFNTTVQNIVGNGYDSDNDWVAQLSVVTYNAKDGYSLYFEKKNTIEANQPYILHLGTAVDSPIFTNVSVVAAEEATQNATKGVHVDDWTMHSNYYDPAFDMNGYYGVVNGEGVLKKGTTGSTLKAFHAYITGPAAAPVKAAYLEEDEADAILELLKGEETGTENIYDLQGRQLPRAGKGINIIRNADGSVRKVLTSNR